MLEKKTKSFHEYDLDFHDGKTSLIERLIVYLIVLGAISEIIQGILMVIEYA